MSTGVPIRLGGSQPSNQTNPANPSPSWTPPHTRLPICPAATPSTRPAYPAPILDRSPESQARGPPLGPLVPWQPLAPQRDPTHFSDRLGKSGRWTHSELQSLRKKMCHRLLVSASNPPTIPPPAELKE